MSAKRIAVIGYGVAGSAFHAPLIAATDGLELAAVVTGDVTRAAQAKERYPGSTWWHGRTTCGPSTSTR